MERCRKTVAVVTVSDKGSRGEREDVSGAQLWERLHAEGFTGVWRTVVPDEKSAIQEALLEAVEKHGAALVVTTGGTGVSPRDVTPEATVAVCDRLIPGMAEAMRLESLRKTPMPCFPGPWPASEATASSSIFPEVSKDVLKTWRRSFQPFPTLWPRSKATRRIAAREKRRRDFPGAL